MKKFLFGSVLFILVGSSFAGDFMGFTKGNRCGQYCEAKKLCVNYCKGDKVFGTTMNKMSTISDLKIVAVHENGVMASNGKNKGFMGFGTFKKRK